MAYLKSLISRRFAQKSLSFITGGLIAALLGTLQPANAQYENQLSDAPITIKLRPTIVKWHGAYAGVVVAGQSVLMQRHNGTTNMYNRGIMAVSGITAGYAKKFNHNGARTIAGIEADVISAGVPTTEGLFQNAWIMTARARYGLPDGNVMPYVTAGIAVSAYADNPWSVSNIQPGLVVGAGMETAGANNIRARLEYLHTWFSGNDYNQIKSSHMLRAGFVVSLK